jgi:hypothetical protein
MNNIPKVHDLERTHGVTWGELAGLEPRLNELLWQARAAGGDCHCREDVARAFEPFRGAVAELVGFLGRNSGHPVLGSVGAYEVAYWRLHDAVCGLLRRPAADPNNAEEKAAPSRTARRRAVAAVS